jgi:hypothetical protein
MPLRLTLKSKNTVIIKIITVYGWTSYCQGKGQPSRRRLGFEANAKTSGLKAKAKPLEAKVNAKNLSSRPRPLYYA